MATSPFEIIAGPANVYIAPTSTAFPAPGVTPPGAWTDLGLTEGGVTVRHSQSVELLMADQHTGPVKAIRSEEGLEIEFALAQLTVEKYSYALNKNTVTVTGGTTTSMDLYRDHDVQTHALLVRGPSPYGDWDLQYEVPIVAQTEEPEVEFTRDDKAVLAVKFVAICDLTVGARKFGRLIAQSA